ncbi:MAG: tetratricopeptide repeat protein [Magnetococcales bacterium]|nr:tetratricopeptide repeat protein [Magnetococcales bacterium]MBF0156886.1 tetratricopeptide repeat protein [Magnetococcales bacterium]
MKGHRKGQAGRAGRDSKGKRGIPTLLTAAVARQQGGDFAGAADLCRQALALDPSHADGHHLLGLALFQGGDLREARQHLQQSVALAPERGDLSFNLAIVHKAAGDPEAAAAAYRQCLSRDPGHVGAHNNLGNLLRQAGDWNGASRCYEAALRLRPDDPEALNNRGVVHKAMGEIAAAKRLFERVLTLAPDHDEARNNLCNLLIPRGGQRQAIAWMQSLLRRRPQEPVFLETYGNALRHAADPDGAIAAFTAALALDPNRAESHFGLGCLHQELGQPTPALHHCRQAVALAPGMAEAHFALGLTLLDLGRSLEAIAALRTALRLNPRLAEVHSALLFHLSYQGITTPERRFQEHRLWARIHAAPPSRSPSPPSPGSMDTAPRSLPPEGGPLRVGYLSPDFRQHAVAYFLEPILTAHDPKRLTLFCYANVAAADAVSERLRAGCSHWREIIALDDDQAEAVIRADHLDILVDLAGHTRGHRLPLLARKPAPVIVTYLGYFDTTGVAGIDYWLSDRVLHPPGEPVFASERVWRLPRTWVCYQPAAQAPEPLPPTAGEGGPIHLGSFNNPLKITPATIALWSRVMREIPHAHLLLKAKPFADPGVRDHFRTAFATHGITEARLRFLHATDDHATHLATYNQVDLALDTFPCTGGTTTADALWMGTPVVTLAGERFIERMSASLLTAVGLTELITTSPEAFVARVVELATDRPRLRKLSRELRGRMAVSELTDAPGLARALESAYEAMAQGRPVLPDDTLRSPPRTELPPPPFYPDLPPISLELTNRCNLKCPYCGNQAIRRPRGEIAWELLEKLVQECSEEGHDLAWLHGCGEPLLYPRLEEAVALVKRHRAGQASFATNATLLDRERSERLLEAGLDRIYFSLDSLDPSVYKRTRGASLAKTLRNIHTFLDLAPDGFRASIALMSSRLQDLDAAAKAAFAREFSRHERLQVTLNPVENTLFPEAPGDYRRQRPVHPGCSQPADYLTIALDGRVALCCVDQDLRHPLGDANRQRLAAIWFDPANQESFLRLALGEGALPRLCTEHCRLRPPSSDRKEGTTLRE